MSTSIDLKTIVTFALSEIGGEEGARNALDSWLGHEGQQAADAIALKVYKQQPGNYTSEKVAASPKQFPDDVFGDFKHYLRVGNSIYPGAPDIPALEGGADIIWGMEDFRSAIRTWCNAAAAKVLANPPVSESVVNALVAGASVVQDGTTAL